MSINQQWVMVPPNEKAEEPEEEKAEKEKAEEPGKEKAEESEKEKAEEPEREHVAKFDEVSNCNTMQLQYMKKLLENSGKVTVMVAGKPRTGKSTALNNLLGLKLPTDYGAKSVTQKVIVESTTSQHGVRVCGIDTPGLKALDLGSKKILDDMSEQIG